MFDVMKHTVTTIMTHHYKHVYCIAAA